MKVDSWYTAVGGVFVLVCFVVFIWVLSVVLYIYIYKEIEKVNTMPCNITI